ncbi:MAG TPA: histidine phosphatase family protein [Steroidobacter sp.]|nr:histidine phosphatase family protein [Steroidobacter sp.]
MSTVGPGARRGAARLVLIRHGEAEAGGVQRMSGWTDLPLSGRGRRQAHLLAARLASEGRSFDAIYASPLQRAAETARVLGGFTARPVRYVQTLKEICCGDLDGLAIREARSRYPCAWRANLRQDDEEFRWPGGESYREFRDRCLQATEQIAQRERGRVVAIVTHAGVISQVFGALRGLSSAQWEPYRPGNASLSEIDWRGPSRRIVCFDDSSHLQPRAQRFASGA